MFYALLSEFLIKKYELINGIMQNAVPTWHKQLGIGEPVSGNIVQGDINGRQQGMLPDAISAFISNSLGHKTGEGLRHC
ncbi:MAG: hypothetical protein ACJAZS_000785 [Alteromonas naphthalenivorans]|jgi:hypothetical protein